MSLSSPVSRSTTAVPREFLSFRVGTEEFAVDILRTLEIRGYDGVTSLPGLPPSIKGIINLRGVIVPVVDLRIRFGTTSPVYDSTTALIVVSLESRTVALVVDSVSEVVALTEDQIRPAPQMGALLETRFIAGLASVGTRMVILLDLAVLLNSEVTLSLPDQLKQAA